MSTHQGRSGAEWHTIQVMVRPGHLRPGELSQVDLVYCEQLRAHGALRRFATRRHRAEGLLVLAATQPYAPVVIDLIDDPSDPPSVITSWVAGGANKTLDQLSEADDLNAMIDSGRRWRPAEALRLLVPIGAALDRLAKYDIVPIELSPDHIVLNAGSVRLVGLSRHTYRPTQGRMPDPGGMSLPTTLLLGSDYPTASHTLELWRRAQQRALLRLAGWMACGLSPAAWGGVDTPDELHNYLRYAGFGSTPALRAGKLAGSLLEAAEIEERAAVHNEVRSAAAVVVYDHAALARATHEDEQTWLRAHIGRVLLGRVQSVRSSDMNVVVTPEPGKRWRVFVSFRDVQGLAHRRRYGEWIDLTRHYTPGASVKVRITHVGSGFQTSRNRDQGYVLLGDVVDDATPASSARPQHHSEELQINPESVRLGLIHDHGRNVLALAAFGSDTGTSNQAALLAAAGWLLVDDSELPATVRRVAALNPTARIVVIGQPSGQMREALPARAEILSLTSVEAPVVIAGQPATELPFVADGRLKAFRADLLDNRGGQSLRRRTFAAGWALALDAEALAAARGGSLAHANGDVAGHLLALADLTGDDTELLVRLRAQLNRPMYRRIDHGVWARIAEAVPVLTSLPANGALRRDIMQVLLYRNPDNLIDAYTKMIAPVAMRLATVYSPALQVKDWRLGDSLRSLGGIARLGLLGRLAIARPAEPARRLAAEVADLDDRVAETLTRVPAPSLTYLIPRMRSERVRYAITEASGAPDADLLSRYTRRAWELLLDQPGVAEQVGTLGLGWALVVEQAAPGAVTPGQLLALAADARVSPAYAVRALLSSPATHWPNILSNTQFASRWLRQFTNLDVVGPVLAAYPDIERLAQHLGLHGLRSAAAAEVSSEDLDRIVQTSERLGAAPDELLHALLAYGRTDELLDRLAAPTALAWVAAHRARGMRWPRLLRTVMTEPEAIRRWMIDGDDLTARLVSDTVGAKVDGDQAERLFAALERNPGLLRTAANLAEPAQRLALLRIAAAHPDWVLTRADLGEILDAALRRDDSEEFLELVLGHHLTLPAAVLTRRLGLSTTQAPYLRDLEPLLSSLAVHGVVALVQIAERDGVTAMRQTAMLEQHRPGIAALVVNWGIAWLPWLAGPQGRRVEQVIRAEVATADLSQWFYSAGEDGLVLLAQQGHRAVDFVRTTRPPVRDVRVVGRVLALTSDPGRLYRLIVKWGLPAITWQWVASQLDSRVPDNEILARLHGPDGRALLATTTA